MRKKLLALAALLVVGCQDNSSPTKTIGNIPPLPPPCPFVLEVVPFAGFPGLYVVTPNPPGDYDISVNGQKRSVELGQLVTAASGDVVQGCRACGCTSDVIVR